MSNLLTPRSTHDQHRPMRSIGDFAERFIRSWAALVLCLSVLSACSSSIIGPLAGVFDEHDDTEGGIGGTGIMGVITDFGSVIVNGRYIQVKPTTRIRQDGERVTAGALRVGQVVNVGAIGDDKNLTSRFIDIRREVVGPITGVELQNGRITVMNQTVVFAEDALTSLSPQTGLSVSVSGFRLPDRSIVATRVDIASPATIPAQLYGQYEAVDDEVRIDGIPVEGIKPIDTLIGRDVFLQGDWDNGRITPIQFEILPESPLDRQGTLSISGFFDSDSSTVSATPVESTSDSLGLVKLSDGRTVSFGIFEGNWSPETASLQVETQISIDNVLETPFRPRFGRPNRARGGDSGNWRDEAGEYGADDAYGGASDDKSDDNAGDADEADNDGAEGAGDQDGDDGGNDDRADAADDDDDDDDDRSFRDRVSDAIDRARDRARDRRSRDD